MAAAAVAAGMSVTMDRGCCDSDKPCPPSKLSRLIEIAGRIALTVFAFVLAPFFMLITYILGILLGASYALIKDIKERKSTHMEVLKPVCAQGYLERLTGKRWPIPVTQLVTDFFIGLHTYHDPKIFGPVFCGLFTGFWTGRFMMNGMIDLSRRACKKMPPPQDHGALACCRRRTA